MERILSRVVDIGLRGGVCYVLTQTFAAKRFIDGNFGRLGGNF